MSGPSGTFLRRREGTSYHVDDCSSSSDEHECTVRFSSTVPADPVVLLSVTLAAQYLSKSAKLAVVIKDFGFTADRTTIDYLSFPEPLSVALLPSRKLSSWTAQISREYKKEIIVLQPMEPWPVKLTPGAKGPACIMIHYPEERLRSIISTSADLVPDCAGFCNSGGARVCEDSRVLSILFSEMKKQRWYFLEESVSRKSLAPSIARSLALPFATIDMTIDSAMKPARIQESIERSIAEAQKRGQCIICSKATDAFLRTLKKELPLLKRNGVRLSYVSELLNPDTEQH